jgi:hypothetical protein
VPDPVKGPPEDTRADDKNGAWLLKSWQGRAILFLAAQDGDQPITRSWEGLS